MDKKEQLNAFISAGEDLILSKYILADVKIANLLKAIAQSETLLALFKNCLTGFDYKSAKKKYLVKSPYLSSDKGEFVLPKNSRELLAFGFYTLMDIDSKNVQLSDFINKYFYEDGSFSAGYSAFVNGMIKPFVGAVKTLMENVIEGKIQDPEDALKQAEIEHEKKCESDKIQAEKDQELTKKVYGENVKTIKNLLLLDKDKIEKNGNKKPKKEDFLLVIDMLANAVESEDKDAIIYSFIAYKYCAKCNGIRCFFKVKKIKKLLQGVLDGI